MNKEILEQAITKAIAGGWEVDLETVLPEMAKKYSLHGLQYTGFSSLLFNHDFARALWGEELHHETFIIPKELSRRFAGTNDLAIKPLWQYHLQQLVISDDPIQYLADNTTG